MKDWEKAEEIVRKLTGGKRTPGSGNKGQQGDVRVYTSNALIEVKQTARDSMNLQQSWFATLEQYADKMDIILVLFFELRGYPYIYSGNSDSEESWKSKRVFESELPPVLEVNGSRWELVPLQDLRTFKVEK